MAENNDSLGRDCGFCHLRDVCPVLGSTLEPVFACIEHGTRFAFTLYPGVVFEAEASGRSKAGGLPTLPFPLSLPFSFPFPLSFQTNQWEGRSDPVRGKFPGFLPLQIPPCPCLPDEDYIISS